MCRIEFWHTKVYKSSFCKHIITLWIGAELKSQPPTNFELLFSLSFAQHLTILFWWVTVVPTASTLSSHSPLLRPLAAVMLYYSNIQTHGTAIVCLDLLPTKFWTGFCLSVDVHSFLFFQAPREEGERALRVKGTTSLQKVWSEATPL